AITYTWTVPAGASITSGQNSTAINVNFTNTYAGGNITVVANFPCGTANTSLAVTGAPSTPIITPAIGCGGSTDFYSVNPPSAGADSYTWTLTGGISLFSNPPVNSDNVIEWGTGSHGWSVTADNGCGSSAPNAVTTSCRIKGDQNLIQTLKAEVYPNPTRGSVTVEFNSPNSDKYALKVTDITGRFIRTELISAVEGMNQHKVDMSSVAKGMYLFHLQNESGASIVIRVAVE
ncbi:MAG: T9SS type A sorting domain-containing protein, partial [Bacteroidia bacterium]